MSTIFFMKMVSIHHLKAIKNGATVSTVKINHFKKRCNNAKITRYALYYDV